MTKGRQNEQDQGGLGKVTEVTDQLGQVVTRGVQDTAEQALGQVGQTVGGLVSGPEQEKAAREDLVSEGETEKSSKEELKSIIRESVRRSAGEA